LRQERSSEPVLLAATDPANPLGVTVPWPESHGPRPQRKAGSLVLLGNRGPLFYLDGSGRSLLAWGDPDPESATLLRQGLTTRRPRLTIRRVNGEEVFTSAWTGALQAGGFRLTPSGLR
jgi:ATP-dependent helicase Lhr and Lhr-like helicase